MKKRLLILTQKADKDDPVLGFFVRWIKEFSFIFSHVTVICLEEGTHELPQNVRVFSLGKEKKRSKLRYAANFYRLIVRERNQYDCVFVHMNPEYVVLGGIIWRMLGKRVALWYTHRSVDTKLMIAEKLVGAVFSSTKESFRIQSSKAHYIGHGIDTDAFRFEPHTSGKPLSLIHAGRLSRIKNCEILIRALSRLDERGTAFRATFYGTTIYPDDVKYQAELEDLANELGLSHSIRFAGPVSNKEMTSKYHEADFTVNLAPTGGMDKVVLESLACGTPTLASNEAFAEVFGPYRDKLMFQQGNSDDLARKITALAGEDTRGMMKELSEIIRTKFSVQSAVTAISIFLAHGAVK